MPRISVTVSNEYVFMVRSCEDPTQTLTWRTTPYQTSATGYSVPKKLDQAVYFLTCIPEVPSCNLGWDTGYSAWDFPVIIPPGKWGNSALS
jgi:hypothetical protein